MALALKIKTLRCQIVRSNKAIDVRVGIIEVVNLALACQIIKASADKSELEAKQSAYNFAKAKKSG
jgi:hypothetical protein